MNLHVSSAPAFVLAAAAFFALPSVNAQAASWPQPAGQSLFDSSFTNCVWTADAVGETSCGYRIQRPVGTFDIVNDQMVIRATKQQDATRANHHTTIEPMIGPFTKGRFAFIGEAYWYHVSFYLENWTSEDSWEIISQWKDKPDGEDIGARNPPVALSVRNGRYQLTIRADSKEATPPSGTSGRYTREDKVDLGPVTSNTWVDWVFKIKWDPFGTNGSIVVWRDGSIVYEEYGQPNTFNDSEGPVWSMGLYKYFSSSQVNERQMRLDDISAAKVSADDPEQPPEQPRNVPASPELLAADSLSSSSIDVTWRDTSQEEAGFSVERQENGHAMWEDVASVRSDRTSYRDNNLSPGTTYRYRVKAYNASGTSAPSNDIAATTLDGIELRVFGYKKRGYHKVFLSFFGSSGGAVDIYRDDTPIDTTTEEVYLDEINKRGKDSYTYKICETANPSFCSPDATIVF